MMMLHERLREWVKSGYTAHLKDVVCAESNGKGYIYPAIANEIERTYIPKHADVKGNPWCEGDECEVILSGRYGLISGYRSDQVLVSFPDGDVWYYPYEIRRIGQDTLERINDDATKGPYMYCVDHGVMLPDSPDLEDVVTAFARDLLKRQREVLERTCENCSSYVAESHFCQRQGLPRFPYRHCDINSWEPIESELDQLENRYKKLKNTADEMLMFIGMSANTKTPCDIDVYMALAKQLKDLERESDD